MTLLIYFLIFAVALTVLIKGSDWFVDSASSIGLSLGISPFIIGVTIVAAGTSLPELASSIAATYKGSSEIVLGNVIGSNIANILLVLGVIAVFAKKINIADEHDIIDVEIPLLGGSALMLWFFARDLHISVFEAILLLVSLVLFIFNYVKAADKGANNHKASVKDYVLLLLSGVLIWAGAEYSIEYILKISDELKIGSENLALSVVALGTSLPEVMVSVTAAKKGNAGLAVGNILGSNIFNTFAVTAIPALISDITIKQSILDFSLPYMVGITFLFAIITISGKVSKWEGYMLILLYVYFISELFV